MNDVARVFEPNHTATSSAMRIVVASSFMLRASSLFRAFKNPLKTLSS